MLQVGESAVAGETVSIHFHEASVFDDLDFVIRCHGFAARLSRIPVSDLRSRVRERKAAPCVF